MALSFSIGLAMLIGVLLLSPSASAMPIAVPIDPECPHDFDSECYNRYCYTTTVSGTTDTSITRTVTVTETTVSTTGTTTITTGSTTVTSLTITSTSGTSTSGTFDGVCLYDVIQDIAEGRPSVAASRQCKMGAEGARKISLVLVGSATTYLSLADNDIGDEGAEVLGQALESNEHLETFVLSSNRIGDKGATALGQALEVNFRLKNFVLSSNSIGEEGATAFRKALVLNKHLESFDLHDNLLKSPGAEYLGEALESNINLKTLRLDSNSIGDEGAKALGKALEVNPHLESIYLRDNAIEAEGAKAIGRGLEKNTVLSTLYLDQNRIGGEGAAAIAQSLVKNTALSTLSLADNNISSEGAMAIAQCLENFLNTSTLDLRQNAFGDEAASAMANSMVKAILADTLPPTIASEYPKTLQGFLLFRLKEHYSANNRKIHAQAKTITVASVCLLIAFICGFTAWLNRVYLQRVYRRVVDEFFPVSVFIPGLSDKVPEVGSSGVEMSELRTAVWRATPLAARRRTSTTSNNHSKFEIGMLKVGRAQVAAGGVPDFIRASPETMRKRYSGATKAVQEEWESLPEEVYVKYMVWPKMNKTQGLIFLHYILFEAASGIEDASNAGDGQTVIRDEGRNGWVLQTFADLPQAKRANLGIEHVLALRIYTSSLFQVINRPFRDSLDGFKKEHPVPITVLLIHEALEKLRQLLCHGEHGDTVAEENEYWRGMKNLDVTNGFLEYGGTELAPMSTSTSKDKIGEYAQSQHPLILRVIPTNFMNMGSDISWLSLYPGEKEILYPPLTYLEPIRKRRIKNHGGWVVDVVPHIS